MPKVWYVTRLDDQNLCCHKFAVVREVFHHFATPAALQNDTALLAMLPLEPHTWCLCLHLPLLDWCRASSIVTHAGAAVLCRVSPCHPWCASLLLQFCVETMMHLTCTNMPVDKLDNALEEVKKAGLQNILALRGDPPKGQEAFTVVEGGFGNALDLVKYIR